MVEVDRQIIDLVKMRRPIQDEFRNLPLSPQRKCQLRKTRDGRCIICGQPAQGARCVKHMVKVGEYLRKRLNLKRRYRETLSYRLERYEGA